MGNPVLDLFRLMLGVTPKLCLYLPNKCIAFSWAFFEKDLEFISGEKSKLITLFLGLILLPPVEDSILQKLCSKKYTLMTLESSNLKMILALLADIIALYMQITIIVIGVLEFKRPIKFISSFTSSSLVLDLLDTCPHKFLKEVIF